MTSLKFTLLVLLIYGSSSCSRKNFGTVNKYSSKAKDEPADYSDLNSWAAHPWKWDPSDSVPLPLKKDYLKDSVADVFFIHPTSFTDYTDTSWTASVKDAGLNLKTDNTSILYQASVFNEQCRVFAPRYRQAHLRAFYSHDKAKADTAFETAYSDVRVAFIYFLRHFNNGRPIIIAAHSQGTMHAGRLLKEFFEGKELQNRLICAYLVGMPVAENYFTSLQPCRDSLSTGCFVSWRTFKRDYTDTLFVSKETFRCIVTNPLTWTTNDDYAPRTLNTGAVLKNFNKISKGVVDAQVHKNILWTCKPKFFGNIFLTQQNYHIADINFFYTNIRQNLKTRIKMFWKQ